MSDKPPIASRKDAWTSGEAYERYVGRWSRLIARDFIHWLGVGAGREWLDVGCGTGALTATILQSADPRRVQGIDFSAAFIVQAQENIKDPRALFKVGDARAVPEDTASYDAVVSALVLNFVPEPGQAVSEMARVTKSGGVAAAYVWDYAGKMEMGS